jgi:hypothetical protein
MSNHRKCHCCKELFDPDYRNAFHQFYCSKPQCRGASKAASQRRWSRRRANRDYFRGKENVQRVQQWRRDHPGYWRKKSAPSVAAQVAAAQAIDPGRVLVTQQPQTSGTLQDVCITGHPVFIGLIAMVTGSTLQEDIASTTRRLEAKGRDILGLNVPVKSPTAYDCKTCDST